MPAKKIKSLHFNLPTQDQYIGGPNVVFHRTHRSRKGRSYRPITKHPLILKKIKRFEEEKLQFDSDLM
jgi:hypothetical protein